MVTGRWRGWSLVLMVVGTVGLAGCSSGGSATAPTAPPSTSTPAAAGSSSVTPAEVGAGLRKIDQTAQEIARYAGSDKARAASLQDQIEPTWEPIEDVVKQNDKNAYISMEDSFSVLEKAADDGDAAAAAKGASAFSSAMQAYLAKYSG